MAGRPTTEGPRADQGRAVAMHGARGIAASMIVLLHAQIYSQAFHGGQWRDQFFRHFDSAVPVFFVLSGFLLYSPFVAAHATGRSVPRFLGYAARRALRIFPGYWAVLVITIIAFSAFDVTSLAPKHPHSFFNGLSWFGLFNQWEPIHDRARAVPQSWTLDIELAFYVALPLVAAFVGLAISRGRSWLRSEFVGLGSFAAISIAVKLIGAAQGGYVTAHVAYIGWPVSYFDGFAIGMALAVVAEWQEQTDAIPRLVRVLLSARTLWGGWVVLFVVGAVALRTNDPLAAQNVWNGKRYLAEYVVYIGLGALLVAPVVLGWGKVGRARRLLSSEPIQRLGTISYGIYLWHFFVYDVVWSLGLRTQGSLGAYALWSVVGMAGSILMASLSWYLLEERALRLKRYFPLAPAPRAEPAQVPA